MRNIVSRAVDIVLAPRARLQSNFPWTLRKMGRTYLFASLWFYLGSLLVPAAFLSLVLLAPYLSDNLIMWVGQFFDNDGQMNIPFLITLSAISFCMGFAFELLYLRAVLHREGRSMRNTMGLNFDRLRGKTHWHTARAVAWRVALAWCIWFALEQAVIAIFGHPPQNTVDLFRSAEGAYFAILAGMAVLGAPVFEELVFRGFLQNGTSASLKQRKLRRALGNAAAAKLVAAAMPDTDKMLQGLGRSTLRLEYLAGIVSAAVFAVMHIQFHPVTLGLLFALGFIHSELYRRTGSLYCSMLLHFVNNGLAVALLLAAR